MTLIAPPPPGITLGLRTAKGTSGFSLLLFLAGLCEVIVIEDSKNAAAAAHFIKPSRRVGCRSLQSRSDSASVVSHAAMPLVDAGGRRAPPRESLTVGAVM